VQREGDQVAELALRHEVLGWEQAVVAGQVKVGADGHRIPEQMHPDPSRRRGRDLPGEEHPDVAAVTGTRALQRSRYPLGVGGVEVGERVGRPTRSVEVARQQPAGIASQQRV